MKNASTKKGVKNWRDFKILNSKFEQFTGPMTTPLDSAGPAMQAAQLVAPTFDSGPAIVLVKEEKIDRGKSFTQATVKAGIHVSLDSKSGSDNKTK
jgi:hypothetical protein